MAAIDPHQPRVVVGQDVSELETPVLLADMALMERHLATYVDIADREGVKLRSHAKAHKVPEIARWQADTTGHGILCQTLGEAELMAANGVSDIYLSYNLVSESKARRAADLARSLDFFATTVDCPEHVQLLQRIAADVDVSMSVVLEIDLGLNRVGVAPGESAVRLAEEIHGSGHLELAGIMGYEGHIGYGSDGARTVEEYERRCEDAMSTLGDAADSIEDHGIAVPEVMAGSTATSKYSARHDAVTEIHPGMYLFNDAHLVTVTPDTTKADCAATVVTSVISKPTADRAIVDGGSKTFSLDLEQPPVPKRRDDIEYYNASEEHGWIDISTAEEPVRVGDRIEFIVPHVCTSINLHDHLVGVRNGRVERVWDVRGRGRVT